MAQALQTSVQAFLSSASSLLNTRGSMIETMEATSDAGVFAPSAVTATLSGSIHLGIHVSQSISGISPYSSS